MVPSGWLAAGALLAASTALARAQVHRFRVFNGVEDIDGKYPYIVAIVNKISERLVRWCTGSLITSEWVLTTAHSLRPSIKFVQYGNMSERPNTTNTKSMIIKMVPHPMYRRVNTFWKNHIKFDNDRSNDIALIRVNSIKMKVYGKLSAVDYNTLTGLSVVYAGFGKTNLMFTDWNRHNTQRLRIGEGIVTLCPNERLLARSFVCVSPKCSDQQTALRGDYGGPLLYDDKIVAVMKAMVSTRRAITRTAWTPLSLHLTWLRQVITGQNHT